MTRGSVWWKFVRIFIVVVRNSRVSVHSKFSLTDCGEIIVEVYVSGFKIIISGGDSGYTAFHSYVLWYPIMSTMNLPTSGARASVYIRMLLVFI